jgi:hypothetical protein
MLGTPEIDVRSYDEPIGRGVTCHAVFPLDAADVMSGMKPASTSSFAVAANRTCRTVNIPPGRWLGGRCGVTASSS